MKYNLIHNLLSIESNTNLIKYVHYAFLLDNSIKGNAKINLKYSVVDRLDKPKHLKTKFDFFWTNRREKLVYYEHPIFLGIRAKMLLDMRALPYSIKVNRIYSAISRLTLGNIWPPGQHFSDLITIELLKDKILTFHCASFSNKLTNEGVLVFGAPNTGKSFTVFEALKKGYRYHSEDLTVLDKDNIYTLPHISSLSDKLPEKNIFIKFNLFFKNMYGLNLLIPRIRTLRPFKNFVENIDIKAKATPKKIFILERGKKGIRRLYCDEAFRKIRILNMMELNYYKDHLLLAYSYFNKELNIENLFNSEDRETKNLVKNVDCYLVTSNNTLDYFDLIETELDKP